jgi:hypothetical protein
MARVHVEMHKITAKELPCQKDRYKGEINNSREPLSKL